jgi:imidazolonepropionase-like amidohydrolase
MRISILLISSFLFFLVSGCIPAEQQKENVEKLENITSTTLALVNGLLIDGTGRDPIYGAMIVIDRERIVYVGSPTQVSIPPNTPVIDVRGAAILPGFVNAHVHGAYDRDTLEEWAFNGVTTVRDLGIIGNNTSLPELIRSRDEIYKDPKYARLVAVGPMIAVPGGYGSHYVISPEHARETVESLLNDGVNLIKIGIEDDLQGRKWEMLSYDEITAIVESAHARNVPVSAHISRSEHLELALQTGIDDVAHMVVDSLSDDLITQVVEAEIYWEPTLELWQCVSELHQLRWNDQAIENLRRFSNAGGKVALGTDYGGYRCDFDLGMPMSEIEWMLRAGMTPLDIIIAGTRNAAHVCNLGNEIGTLEPGKIADILVVVGNPLEDMQVLEDVMLVIHNGNIIRE